MTELAKNNAAAIGAGHSFIVLLGDGAGVHDGFAKALYLSIQFMMKHLRRQDERWLIRLGCDPLILHDT